MNIIWSTPTLQQQILIYNYCYQISKQSLNNDPRPLLCVYTTYYTTVHSHIVAQYLFQQLARVSSKHQRADEKILNMMMQPIAKLSSSEIVDKMFGE